MTLATEFPPIALSSAWAFAETTPFLKVITSSVAG